MHKIYMKNIDFAKYKERIIDIIDMLICEVKEIEPELYEHIECELYEIAYGKVITEENAINWVKSMKPVGMHWTIEETTNAMRSLNYNCDQIEFFVVSNMLYNDNYDLIKDNEEMTFKLAYNWLKDEDSNKDKLYEYWKYIVKRD